MDDQRRHRVQPATIHVQGRQITYCPRIDRHPLASLLDKTADDIASVDIDDIFERLGLGRHLSLNRRNGFFAMVERIKGVAANA